MMMRKTLLFFCLTAIALNANAENYLKKPLKEKGIHFLIETGVGHSYYSSLGRVYETNQTVYYASSVLGYDIKSLFLGIGGSACRHTKEHLYSFRVFLDTRYSFRTIPLKPYGEILGGCVGYFKWNDFVKPYCALGVGFHILPRLSTGIRVSKVGTLDDKSSMEWSLNVSFKF